MNAARLFRQDNVCQTEAPFRPNARNFRKLPAAPSDTPTLMVVVDTEEEFDWSAPYFDPESRSVTNVAEQHRAQTILRRHGIVATYCVDYPVAADPHAVAVLRRFADAGEIDIGAHLHPWVTPPLAGRVTGRLAYPGNLPPSLESEKLGALTRRIEEAFGRAPRIYKAGRYGLGQATPALLRRAGYRIDVSLVPFTDFSADGGPDFSGVDNRPVLLADGIVGLPLSVGFTGILSRAGKSLYPWLASPMGRRLRISGMAARLGVLERLRLSPEGHSTADMMRQIQAGLRAGLRSFMLTYHSSSLLPGATPYVRDAAEREAFLKRLEQVIAGFMTRFGGQAVTVMQAADRLQSADPS